MNRTGSQLPSNTYQAPGCQWAMTSPDASPSRAARISSASSLLRLRLWFPSSGSRLCACTKHLSGILFGALLPLRVPETHRFPRSSNQSRAGSSSSWLRARERGRALRRDALRRSTNVRRGGGIPIKACGCRAFPMKPSRDSQRLLRSQISGSLRGLEWLVMPWVPI